MLAVMIRGSQNRGRRLYTYTYPARFRLAQQEVVVMKAQRFYHLGSSGSYLYEEDVKRNYPQSAPWA